MLGAARRCAAALDEKFQLPGSPVRVPLIANQARACSEQLSQRMDPAYLAQPALDHAFWSFCRKLIHYFGSVSDEFSVLYGFNEAVLRNDARVVIGITSSLLTQDEKKLIPSAVTTGMLSARFRELREELPARMTQHTKRLGDAKFELYLAAGILFDHY